MEKYLEQAYYEQQWQDRQRKRANTISVCASKAYLQKVQVSQHVILKEDWIIREVQKFYKNQQKLAYAVLTRNRLVLYDNDEKIFKKNTKCFNFIYGQLLVESESKLKFSLMIRMKKYNFKVRSEEELATWISLLKNCRHQNPQKPVISKQKDLTPLQYSTTPRITINHFLQEAQTGDLLLCRNSDSMSTMQRIVTMSDYDHVCFIIKFDKKDVRIFHAHQKYGVQILCWPDHIKKYKYVEMSYRKLKSKNGSNYFQKSVQFIKKNIGKKYALSISKIILGQTFHEDGYFCSQLVAKIYKTLGLLEDTTNSSKYWPVDFTTKRELKLKNAILQHEQIIQLN